MWKRMWGNTYCLCWVSPSSLSKLLQSKFEHNCITIHPTPHQIFHYIFFCPSHRDRNWVRMEVSDADTHSFLSTSSVVSVYLTTTVPSRVILFLLVAPLLKCISGGHTETWKGHKVFLETWIGCSLPLPLSLRSEKGILETHAWSSRLQNETPVSKYRNITWTPFQ